MAFSDFQMPEVLGTFGLTHEAKSGLFAGVPDLVPDERFFWVQEENNPLGSSAHSEAARSAFLVAPLLCHLWNRLGQNFNLQFGVTFNADPEANLVGFCDALICRSPQASYVVAPVAVVFEAKRDSIPDAMGQAVAGMVGAQRYNVRSGKPIDPIYGAVTTGSVWKFLRLQDKQLDLDLTEYYYDTPARLLGILAHMVGPVPGKAAA